MTDIQKKMLMGRRLKAEKMARGASDGFRGNQHVNPVKHQNDALPDRETHLTANSIAKEMGVSRPTVERAERFVDGVNAAEEVFPGITKDITSGKIKPKQSDVVAIAKAPAEERKQMAKNLYKELTPEEKERRKRRRDFTKSIAILDQTHMPSADNKIQPEDMLMTFGSKAEEFIRTMNFCLDYSPELLTEPKYFEQVKKTIQPIKDFIKTLEENGSATIIPIAK